MKKIGWIFFLFIIVILVNIHGYTEHFEEKKHYDCIISINVHEKFDFLLKQLKNIKENVNVNYAVILNCNDHMFHECNNNRVFLSENVYMYNTPINKKHWHGSLCQGIYTNMQYALSYFTFDFFIVTSSRNMFTNNLTLEDLNKMVKKGKPHNVDNLNTTWQEKKDSWHWPVMSSTLIGKYFIERNQNLYSNAHEGLVFTYTGCKKIVDFLEEKPEMKEDMFNIDTPMEEFALQTISLNLGEYFYYIGNGCCSEGPIETNSPNGDIFKFMYKTSRDAFVNPNTFISCSNNGF